MLLFVTEPIFLLKEEAWSMHSADTQCTAEGREGQRKVFMFKFFFCLAIKYINFMSWMCTGS